MTRQILFVPLHSPSMLEMIQTARKIAEDGQYKPCFFIFRDISDAYLRQLIASGFRLTGPKTKGIKAGELAVRDPASGVADLETGVSGNFRKRLLAVLFSLSWFSFLFYFLKFSRQLSKSKAVLRTEDVAAVLVIGDRHLGWETALIKAANDLGLPTLIVPYALSDPDVLVKTRLRNADVDQYRVKGLLGRIAHYFCPEWTRDSDDGPLFFAPVGQSLAAKALGIMPSLPWTLGGGAAKRMTVESPRVLETYLKAGISPEKLVLTGKPSVDQVYDVMQAVEESQLRTTLNIGVDQVVILCSVPQLGEHNLLSWSDHWREIEFLFKTLTKDKEPVVILSLHPKSNPEDYRPLAEKYGAIIANQRIYELIPICNFLVANYSSVVVQAIGCGKPAVVVDFYGLDFPFYDDEPGVVVIKDRDAFAPELDRLLKDPAYYQSLSDAQLARSEEWIILDGGSTQRVVDELYQMLE